MDNYDMNDFRAISMSNIPSTLTSVCHFDSADDASAFFARELDFIKAKTYDKLYPEFSALNGMFPITSEVDPGAETMTYYSYEKTGVAQIIANYATDLPRADIKGTPTTAYIKSIGTSYGYNVQEMRASRLANKSLDKRKGESARYQNDRLLNKIAFAGDATANLTGILTSSNNIPRYTLATVSVGGQNYTDWAHKTAAQILADISGIYAAVANTTKNVERPNVLALPSDVYVDISTRRVSDYSDTTVRKFIEMNAPYLSEIISVPELNYNSTETNPYSQTVTQSGDPNPQGVLLLYTKDADKLCIEHPLPFMQYPVQIRNLEMVVPCESRTAGAVIYYPYSAIIAAGV